MVVSMWRFFLRTGKLREWSLEKGQPLYWDGGQLRVGTQWSLGAHSFGDRGPSGWLCAGVRVASMRECVPTVWWPWAHRAFLASIFSCTLARSFLCYLSCLLPCVVQVT